MSLVNVYETEFEFRSLMAWGKKLLLSLSVFAIMLMLMNESFVYLIFL